MKRDIVKFILIILIVSLGFLGMPNHALASTPNRLIVGNNFTLKDGDTLDEDLLVIGGLATLENGSILNGNVFMIGGTLDASGQINGDIIVVGGSININATAVITGDITAAGANLQRDPDAQISGEITSEQEGPFIVSPTGVRIPQLNLSFSHTFSIFSFILQICLWALLAMLLALFLPKPLTNIARTIGSQPWASGGLGLLTVIILPILLVIIALTILLIPVSLLGILLLVSAWVFGTVALGTELGKRFAGIFNSEWHPALAAGAGTLLMMLVINGIQAAIPCLGFLPKFIVGVLGVGAVLLTRFGRRSYPPVIPLPTPETINSTE